MLHLFLENRFLFESRVLLLQHNKQYLENNRIRQPHFHPPLLMLNQIININQVKLKIRVIEYPRLQETVQRREVHRLPRELRRQGIPSLYEGKRFRERIVHQIFKIGLRLLKQLLLLEVSEHHRADF